MPHTWSQMTENKTLNSCFLLHVHKNLSDDLDIVSTEKEFIQNTHKCVIYFNYFFNFDLMTDVIYFYYATSYMLIILLLQGFALPLFKSCHYPWIIMLNYHYSTS